MFKTQLVAKIRSMSYRDENLQRQEKATSQVLGIFDVYNPMQNYKLLTLDRGIIKLLSNNDFVVAICGDDKNCIKAPTVQVIETPQSTVISTWVCPLPEITAVAINNSSLVAFTYEQETQMPCVSVYDVIIGTLNQSVPLPPSSNPAPVVDAYLDNEANLFYWSRNSAMVNFYNLHTADDRTYEVDRVGKNCVHVDPAQRIKCDIEQVLLTKDYVIALTLDQVIKLKERNLRVWDRANGTLVHFERQNIDQIALSIDQRRVYIFPGHCRKEIFALNLYNFAVQQVAELDCCVFEHYTFLSGPECFVVVNKNEIQTYNFKNLMGYRLVHSLRTIKTHVEELDLLNIKYKKTLRNKVILPQMFNIAHIFSLYKADNALGEALKDNCPILEPSKGQSALGICLSLNNWAAVNIIIDVIAEKPNQESIMTLQPYLPAITRMKCPGLASVYHNMLVPVKYMPPFMHLKEIRSTKWFNTRGMFIDEFVDDTPSDDEIEVFYDYKVSAIQLDTRLGAKKSNELVASLINTPNEEIYKSEIVKQYTNVLWKQAVFFIIMQAMFYLAFVVLISLTIFYDIETLWILLVMFVYNLVFLIYELTEVFISPKDYQLDTWNMIDYGRIFAAWIYLLNKAIFNSLSDEFETFCLTMAIFLNWTRMISFYRLFSDTRYLIRMIIEIIKGMLPFLIIFLSFVIALTFAIAAMRDQKFEDAWMKVYRLSYADFELMYVGDNERIMLMVMTMMLPLVMLNLLIAIMGDIYGRVQQRQAIEDERERLLWIQEMGRLAWWRTSPTWKYIHQVISSQYIEEYDDSTQDESLVNSVGQSVKMLFAKSLAKIQTKLYDDLSDRVEAVKKSQGHSMPMQSRLTTPAPAPYTRFSSDPSEFASFRRVSAAQAAAAPPATSAAPADSTDISEQEMRQLQTDMANVHVQIDMLAQRLEESEDHTAQQLSTITEKLEELINKS